MSILRSECCTLVLVLFIQNGIHFSHRNVSLITKVRFDPQSLKIVTVCFWTPDPACREVVDCTVVLRSGDGGNQLHGTTPPQTWICDPLCASWCIQKTRNHMGRGQGSIQGGAAVPFLLIQQSQTQVWSSELEHHPVATQSSSEPTVLVFCEPWKLWICTGFPNISDLWCPNLAGWIPCGSVHWHRKKQPTSLFDSSCQGRVSAGGSHFSSSRQMWPVLMLGHTKRTNFCHMSQVSPRCWCLQSAGHWAPWKSSCTMFFGWLWGGGQPSGQGIWTAATCSSKHGASSPQTHLLSGPILAKTETCLHPEEAEFDPTCWGSAWLGDQNVYHLWHQFFQHWTSNTMHPHQMWPDCSCFQPNHLHELHLNALMFLQNTHLQIFQQLTVPKNNPKSQQ